MLQAMPRRECNGAIDSLLMRATFAMLCVMTASAVLANVGCVRRTIAITSTPSEALVYVNDREVGRTPCEVEFMFYGEYDVRLVRDGFDSVIGSGTASAPVWDFIGADLVAELAPLSLESRVEWHFELQPANNSHEELLARARALRQSVHEFPMLTPDERGDAAASQGTPGAPSPSQGENQGALPPKGSPAVPVPPTDLPSDVPGGAPGVAPPGL